MREDRREQLEAWWPEGFLLIHLDTQRHPHITGKAIDRHPFLTALFHIANAIAALTTWHLPLPPPSMTEDA